MLIWQRFRGLCELLPVWVIAVAARIGLARVFGASAEAHLANWQTTLYLFDNTYNLPLLPPHFAAMMTIVIEVCSPFLLLLGLATRLTSLVLLGMTLVIEIFVFPQAWPTHIQWAVMMLVLLRWGPGPLSLDGLVARFAGRGQETAATLPVAASK